MLNLSIALGLALLMLANTSSAAEPSADRQQAIVKLLKNDCGACHGLTLKGGLGPSLLPQAISNKSDDLLLQTIQQGRPGTPMPPWRDFLSKDETLWLIKKLRQP
jgi:cytochrome c55X